MVVMGLKILTQDSNNHGQSLWSKCSRYRTSAGGGMIGYYQHFSQPFAIKRQSNENMAQVELCLRE
jgi:hypothetical protein